MMVMTAKVNPKKIIALLAVLAAVVIGLVMLLGGADDVQTTAAEAVTDNDARVKFLENFGWDVAASPVESGKVRIPAEASEVFDRYAQLQKSQGYDLAPYAGKTVMRFVYQINNFPNATEPVYATLLISKGQVIGGDVTNTAADGKVQGFAMPEMPN
ncbi:MAG: DUF4830 domain-containing protein [Oscillospiraceae bacterium]|nr:DUF4830 domain-containing protein [Oscillospiraceae bacterium]